MWRKVWIVVSEGKTGLFNTNDYAFSSMLCDKARQSKLMIGLIGDTGMGKTTALQIISRRKNTYYVAYDKTMKAKQFFAAILKEMAISFEGSIYDMVNRIAEELNTSANPLLIIDEAGKITHNVMLYMHSLRDKTNRNCGIVLAGMPYFKNNLQKNSNKQKEGFAEFFRRIQAWFELQGLSRTEIKYICNHNGILDDEEVRDFYGFKKFGDLNNAILMHQLELVQSLTQ
jgi:type II secretory pathway predicted ATPase ExeA